MEAALWVRWMEKLIFPSWWDTAVAGSESEEVQLTVNVKEKDRRSCQTESGEDGWNDCQDQKDRCCAKGEPIWWELRWRL